MNEPILSEGQIISDESISDDSFNYQRDMAIDK